MDVEILVSSILKAHGFAVNPRVLTVRSTPIVVVDFHLDKALLYTELDLKRGFAYNSNFYVNPANRHQGTGARLIMAHEEICREAELTILINNNRNPALWRQQGYRRLNPFWQIQLARQLSVEFTKDSMYKKP